MNRKEYRSLQENWRHHRNTSCKDGHSKGQKSQRPNKQMRLTRGHKNALMNYTKMVIMTRIEMMLGSPM